MSEDIKEKLKEKLKSELSEPQEPEAEAEHEEYEEIEEVQRMSFEEFNSFARNNFPFQLLVQNADTLLSQKLGLNIEEIQKSKITTSVLYIPYWYLAPYLTSVSEETIPEPFRPLVASIMALAPSLIKSKFKGGIGQNAHTPF